MGRWLAVAALGAAFLALPGWGQRRGGGSPGFAGHGGFAPRGAVGGVHAPAMAARAGLGGSRIAPRWGNGFHRPPNTPGRPSWRGRPYFHHHHRGYPWYYGSGWWGYPGWGWGWNWGWYGPGWYSDYSYPQQTAPPYDYSDAYYAQHNQIEQEQQAEIDRLHDELAQLREERESESRRTSQPEDRSKAAPEITQLVFNDQHIEQVQNYAVVGQTLWVFTEQRARKIPLADLDIPATQRVNDDRGVEFQLPK